MRQCCLNMFVIAIFCTVALVLPLPLSICSHPNQAAYAKHLPSPLPRHPTKARSTKPPQLTVSKFPKPETAKSLKPPPLPARKPEAQSALPRSSPESPPPPTRKSEVQSALPPSSSEFALSSPTSPEFPLPRSSPSTSILPAIATIPPTGLYVVRDESAIAPWFDYKPSASTGLKIIEKSNYAECKDVVEKEALIGAVEQGAEDKFKAAQAKAEKLGGVDKLTPKDIEGLSIEQIKQLRGY